MSERNLIMTLGKVMVAAAWADGKVTQTELNSLKDLLFRLPNMTAHQWAELDIYIDSPVDEMERARLIGELKEVITSPEEKALALNALYKVTQADGQVSESENAVLQEVEAALASIDEGFLDKLGRLIKGPVEQRSQLKIETPNREDYLEEFMKNKVYYDIRRRLDQGEIKLDIPEEKLRKLGLAGALMARVARVSAEISDEEFYTMVGALQQIWRLTRDEATLVAEIAASDKTINMDYFRTARQFVKICSREECLQFIDILFVIAAADGQATYEEIEQIRQVAQTLLLTNEQFIEAKQKIPREQREQ